jgi:hypothetical protein
VTVFSGPNRGGSGAGQHIAIELLGEGISAEAFDVELGGGRRRTPSAPNDGPPPSRAWKILVGVAAVSVLIGGIVWLSGSRKSAVDESTQPSTTVPETTTTVQLGSRVVTTLGASAPTGPPTTVPDSFVINVGSPIVDLEGSTAVYFVDESGYKVTYRLDQATGVIERWDDPNPNSGFVVAIVGSPDAPISIRGYTQVFNSMRRNADGTLWVSRDGSIEQIASDGVTTLRTVESPWRAVGALWIELLGTDAEDNPVIAAVDGSSFAVHPDGSLTRLSENYLVSVEHGNQLSTVCAVDATCQNVMTTPFGTVASPRSPYWYGPTQSFSPDGRWAIEESTDESGNQVQWLINFETGARTAVDIGPQNLGMGGEVGPLFRSNWTADSSHYVSRRRSERSEDPIILTVLDAATGSISGYPLPPEVGALLPIAVL